MQISDTERYNEYEIKYSNERHTREIRDLENLHHEVLEEVRSKHQKLVTDKTKVVQFPRPWYSTKIWRDVCKWLCFYLQKSLLE